MSDDLTRKDLEDMLAKQENISAAEAKRRLDSVLHVIKVGLKKKKKINIVGYFKLEIKRRKARTGHNPKTMETIKIPATNVITFKAGKTFKDYVNNKTKK